MLTSEETSLCRSCKQTLPVTMFWKRKRNPSGLGTQCKPCATSKPGYKDKSEKNKKYYNPVYHQDWHYKTNYGISTEQVLEMAELQNHRCFICDTHAKDSARGKLCVDHNHTTGTVRKLLCSKCNSALGLVNENLEVLAKMASYLEEHS